MIGLTRKKYQEIKKYDHMTMQRYLNGVYETGMEDAEINYEVLSEKLVKIRGITAAKTQEIIRCIKEIRDIQKELREAK